MKINLHGDVKFLDFLSEHLSHFSERMRDGVINDKFIMCSSSHSMVLRVKRY
jgi:hypothetical protein